MKKVLVDTGHWVGAFYKRDKWRELGLELLEWFDKQDKENLQIIITYGILTEVIARLINKAGFDAANKVLDFFRESDKITIYNDTYKFEEEIYEIFKKYKGLSLVDSEIVVRYYNIGCDYLLSTAGEFTRCTGLNCFKSPV